MLELSLILKYFSFSVAVTLAMLLGTGCSNQTANAADVYQGCAAPPSSFQHIFHVNPRALGGDGSTKSPFGNLAAAVKFARGGDEILLADGNYGDLNLRGANSSYVVIAAEPGRKPHLASLLIAGYPAAPSHWAIEGMTFTGRQHGGLAPNGWQTHLPEILAQNANNLYFAHNTVATVEGVYEWTAEVKGVPDLVPLADGVRLDNVSCASLIDNQFHNLNNAIQFGGDQKGDNGHRFLVSRNKVDEFAADGIDIYGSDVIVSENLIENGHDICNTMCIHQDGIQGWAYNNLRDITNSNVTIERNTVLASATVNPAFPPDTVQGITLFDGNWSQVHIVNNTVVVNSWHGISLYGARSSEILNNTVLGTDPKRTTWISVQSKKGVVDDSGVSDVLVRNNLTPRLTIGRKGQGMAGVQVDHNVLIGDPQRIFRRVDPAAAVFDFHLRANSPAIGAGSPNAAPSNDIDGTPRVGRIDAGAFAAAH
jgi:parallel beta-helix repeat protein